MPKESKKFYILYARVYLARKVAEQSAAKRVYNHNNNNNNKSFGAEKVNADEAID